MEITDLPEAMRKVEKLVTVKAELYAINVDGEPLVAFVNKDDADETLKLVKSYYENKLPNKQLESTFKGSVYVEQRHVRPRHIARNSERCPASTHIDNHSTDRIHDEARR